VFFSGLSGLNALEIQFGYLSIRVYANILNIIFSSLIVSVDQLVPK